MYLMFFTSFLLQFVIDASELVEKGKDIITAAIATLFNYFFKVLKKKTTIHRGIGWGFLYDIC